MNEDYINRINKILTYIDENLDKELSLESMSKIAFYSPFHLHRLFKAITNETLNSYVSRKRVEKAAMQLIHRKELTIFEIAVQSGFTSNSSFTRAFNKLYGQSPTNFRSSNSKNFSKISKTDSKNGKVNFITEEYICNIINLENWIKMNAKPEIKEMPTMKLAYMTQIGVKGIETAFERMLRWARPKGLLAVQGSHVVRIFHDSFKITDADKVRMSICVTLNDAIQTEGEVGLTSIENGKCIVSRFEIEIENFEKSWDGLFIWMNEKGYKKADRFPFEVYHNYYKEHPGKKCIVDLCIPIE
jgi:AraC family transcriptional regulator